MTLEGETSIGLTHTTAVVNDLDRGTSGIDDDDMDSRRPSIDSILHQLLHHGGGALDYLTSCDLVGDAIREKTYYVHN